MTWTVWYLVLLGGYNHPVIIPTPFPTEELCTLAGKEFWNGSQYECVPGWEVKK